MDVVVEGLSVLSVVHLVNIKIFESEFLALHFTKNTTYSTVFLKLGTALPLGSAKQFQGDRKEITDF